MFIGREQELRTLNQLYASGKFEFAVIYGRRRVGKRVKMQSFSPGWKPTRNRIWRIFRSASWTIKEVTASA